jgi:hypothetical protein
MSVTTGSVFAVGGIKQLDGIFAGRSYYGLKSAVAEAFLDEALNKLIVFNDQNKYLIFHLEPSERRNRSAGGTRGGETIVPKKVCKSAHPVRMRVSWTEPNQVTRSRPSGSNPENAMFTRGVAALALLVALGQGVLAAERPRAYQRVSCTVVRFYVAKYSQPAAESWARSRGATDADIEGARRCLGGPSVQTASFAAK